MLMCDLCGGDVEVQAFETTMRTTPPKEAQTHLVLGSWRVDACSACARKLKDRVRVAASARPAEE